MKIELISDIVCPWCAIGLSSLDRALERIGGDIAIELHIRPFELNPAMAPEGEDLFEHVTHKYGLGREAFEQGREALRVRAAAVGFELGRPPRIWNSFDAHRLLHWAGLESPQHALTLKRTLLRAYHSRGENIASHAVLAAQAREAGFDEAAANEVLASGRHGDEVRRQERRWQRLNIHAVPSMLIGGEDLLQGAHPPEVIEPVLRQLAAVAGQSASASS